MSAFIHDSLNILGNLANVNGDTRKHLFFIKVVEMLVLGFFLSLKAIIFNDKCPLY